MRRLFADDVPQFRRVVTTLRNEVDCVRCGNLVVVHVGVRITTEPVKDYLCQRCQGRPDAFGTIDNGVAFLLPGAADA